MGRLARADVRPGSATQQELRAAIEGLSPTDKIRLEKLAKSRSARLGASNWEELLQEAIVRALAGGRPWPKRIPLVAFLAEVMRSIASDWARQSARAVPLPADENELPADDPSPDRSAVARVLLGKLEAEFAEDAEVRALLNGLYAGETAPETMKRTGLALAQYDAARKRLRRGVNKLLDLREMN